jgi:DNA repair exonuclease SbcCD ATPase subunit
MTSKNTSTSTDPAETVNELERLRDILYGERVRSIEGRLDEIDQRLTRTANELNRRIDHEVEELVQRLDAAAKRLDERILALQAQSNAELRLSVEELTRRLEQQAAQQDQDLQAARASVRQELEELRAEILAWRQKTGQTLAALIRHWSEETMQE